jgi:uncharacterized protein YkwD
MLRITPVKIGSAFFFLAVLVAALLQPSLAWGQLRIHSGAVKSSANHPKALEKRIFHLTNEARRKNGLPAFDQDDTLTAQAREKSDEMIKSHRISQSDRDRERKIDRFGKEEPAKIGWSGKPGENIHMGFKDDYSDIEVAARLIVNGFMASTALRSNILNPAFTHLGVGVSIKGKESYVAQEFGPNERRSPEVLPNKGEK